MCIFAISDLIMALNIRYDMYIAMAMNMTLFTHGVVRYKSRSSPPSPASERDPAVLSSHTLPRSPHSSSPSPTSVPAMRVHGEEIPVHGNTPIHFNTPILQYSSTAMELLANWPQSHKAIERYRP